MLYYYSYYLYHIIFITLTFNKQSKHVTQVGGLHLFVRNRKEMWNIKLQDSIKLQKLSFKTLYISIIKND